MTYTSKYITYIHISPASIFSLSQSPWIFQILYFYSLLGARQVLITNKIMKLHCVDLQRSGGRKCGDMPRVSPKVDVSTMFLLESLGISWSPLRSRLVGHRRMRCWACRVLAPPSMNQSVSVSSALRVGYPPAMWWIKDLVAKTAWNPEAKPAPEVSR